ncbi:TIGR03084 family metal-binding protein [Actinocrispum sp. NPDC049592]|uniref:TIGR03084 family metal-binding protein n=1 Tax=Actinocrispum sp. NPDC049592 TaxID=3154835 RepID=UPI0034469CFA
MPTAVSADNEIRAYPELPGQCRPARFVRVLLQTVLDDLRAEQEELDALAGSLTEAQWRLATPSPGWTVAHQIAHLAWCDDAALLAVTDKQAFLAFLDSVRTDPQAHIDRGAAEGAAASPEDLLARWRAGRGVLLSTLRRIDAGSKLAWFGQPLNVVTLGTARLMEVWAHGLDVADALGVTREPTHRLRHIAYLGVRTRDNAFHRRGLTPPEPFRVSLSGPDNQVWTWGPPEADQRVTGTALDFCKLITRRIHRDDTTLTAVGADAERWLHIAQCFAGPPGPGRPPKTTDTRFGACSG